MGGHASGDVASDIVRKTLLASSQALPDAILQAHANIAAAAGIAGSNMASTVVAAQFMVGRAQVVWVGDSRAYLWRRGQLLRLTRDHSYLEVLHLDDKLTHPQLREHPKRHLVTQTLGLGAPEAASNQVVLRNGDWLLLCSDGLNGELSDEEIAAVMRMHADPSSAAPALIAAALEKGCRDNVSAIVVEYDGPDGVSLLNRLKQQVIQWLPALTAAAAIVALTLLARRMLGR